MRRICGCFALSLLLTGSAAYAQSVPTQTTIGPRTYDVKSMNFDLWCQETQRFPAERCEKRAPTDVKAFEDYRAAVERYEIQYLKQREQERAASARGRLDTSRTVRTLEDQPIQ